MTKAIRYGGSFVVALVMLLAVATLFAPRFGWQVDTVLSGSMSPSLAVGSAVVTQPVDPHTIQVGDIITYRSPRDGKMTTHRVVGIEEGSALFFQTKGDANENPDPYVVPLTNIEGKVALDAPLLGYVTAFAKTPLGFALMLGVPGLMIILLEMRIIWVALSEEEKRKKAKVGGAVKAGERGYASPGPDAAVVGGEE